MIYKFADSKARQRTDDSQAGAQRSSDIVYRGQLTYRKPLIAIEATMALLTLNEIVRESGKAAIKPFDPGNEPLVRGLEWIVALS